MYLVYTASVKYISSIHVHVYEKQKFKRLSKMSQLHCFNLPEIEKPLSFGLVHVCAYLLLIDVLLLSTVNFI